MTWTIRHNGRAYEVLGPYRRNGLVTAVSAEEQRAWARSHQAQLPTCEQFDLIWDSATIQVPPRPRNVVTASLSSLDDDVHQAGAGEGDRVACGKTWVNEPGASATRAVNYGWHVPHDETQGMTWKGIRVYHPALQSLVGRACVVQPPGRAHGWGHVDYSQAGYAVRDVDETEPAPDSEPDTEPGHDLLRWRGLSLGERIAELAGWEWGHDVREVPGAGNNPRILQYSRKCRRGGVFLGVSPEGEPRWEHHPTRAVPLALPRDADAWCAAFRSYLLLRAMLHGDTPPHGLRVSVRELCEDGRRNGTLRLHSDGYRPKLGDAVIYGRNGQDPLSGGQGHVTTAIAYPKDEAGRVRDDVVRCIGGNERNAVRVQDRTLVGPGAPVGYVVA